MTSFFCSWSGGKDSCLALYRAMQRGGRIPKLLFTMMTENKDRSHSHGLPIPILEEQARSLGVPLIRRSASWADYEAVFLDALGEFRGQGITTGVFGDIDLEPHRAWVERVCQTAGIRAEEPLWQEARQDLLREFLNAGFKAVVVSIKEGVLDRKFLGRLLSFDLIQEFEAAGIDPSGEKGEYHTVVVDGPAFSFPVRIEFKEQEYHEGYWFQDLASLEG
ncbi:MAG TPA: diphthine--ammonia ligase [Bacillota bacterium]|nr:diphthine--ammonia ligase [Bacillota bacterium]